ncbi:hypothetical protein [Paenibacillus sp. FSL P4-0502]|uniref:hypothetical protein n=1 Tax=Paenibacillus sp. FSL P4-0502 TaxID=2975319 RepID=UPI0030F5DFBD
MNKLIDNYNDTAILINAVHVAIDRYEKKGNNVGLSTTKNIPQRYRLAILEMDYVFDKNKLIRRYRNESINKIARDYLITTVSTLDAYLEEVYAVLLKKKDPTFTDKQIDKEVRESWRDEKIRKFMVNEANILVRDGKLTTPDMAFDRYQEFRILRHAVVHNDNILSNKHIAQLNDLNSRLPDKYKEIGYTMLESEFIDKNKIILDNKLVFGTRKWAFEFLAFIAVGLEEGNS